MNLKEALDYRRNCIIHGLPLKAAIFHKGKIELRDNSLLVKFHKNKSDHCGLRFSFNGTFIRANDCPKQINNTLTINMVCDECAKVKWRPSAMLGVTSLENILDVQYYYSIFLTGGPNNKYVAELKDEEIRYHTNDKFYHIGVDLQTKKARCTIGSCRLFDKFDDILRGLSIMEIPVFNIEKIQNIEQYVNKLKLYNLFS